MNAPRIVADCDLGESGESESTARVLQFMVAIPTYRRPEVLRTCLQGVVAQVKAMEEVTGRPLCGCVLVVDNDPEASARATVSGAGKSVSYVVESRPGIAHARNRALAEAADYDLLIFIDDDERPQPDWLGSLLRTWVATKGTAVMGRVVSEFEVQLTPWVAAGDFFWRKSMPTGTEIPIAAAGNLLLDLNQIRAAGVTFDECLGLGGGEDTLFSIQLTRSGGRIVWCDESVAIDMVPAERCRTSWVLQRSWSHGNNAVVVALRSTDGRLALLRVRAVAIAGGLLRMAGGLARSLYGMGARSLRHQARGVRTACKGGGMVSAGLGLRHYEYARK